MAKDITVLAPNGRRVKVHCTADTSILQLLEDVCAKQGFQSSDYDLKHHNHILDLTTTVRFCNLPNKAFLEMVEAEKKRVESNVTVGLTFNDGERKMGEFPPRTSLYDLIITLAPNELPTLQNPTIIYMRQEVTGVEALKQKTLRQLGLITGRAILRLLDKTEPTQANVSSVYRRVQTEKKENDTVPISNLHSNLVDVKHKEVVDTADSSGIHREKDTHKSFDPIKLLQEEKQNKDINSKITESSDSLFQEQNTTVDIKVDDDLKHDNIETKQRKLQHKHLTQEDLERRIKIEEEVTFVGSQKAIAFMKPDDTEDDLSDLPDDFYELTIEEVRKMYRELQERRQELENTPILTTAKREELAQQESLQKLNTYKNVVVRIQFPDNMILQGVFNPNNTIEDIQNFVREHLQYQDKQFHIFTTPLKETLNPKITLLEAKFVPCVHMHFKWLDDRVSQPYLKEEIYSKTSTSDAASILASKYRAPTRRKLEEVLDTSQKPQTSSSKQSKVPKWFKK